MHRCINRLYILFCSLLPLHACTLHCLKRYIVARNLLYIFDFFSWQAIRTRFASLRNMSPMRHDTQWRSFDHRTFLSFLSSSRGRSTLWNILFHFVFFFFYFSSSSDKNYVQVTQGQDSILRFVTPAKCLSFQLWTSIGLPSFDQYLSTLFADPSTYINNRPGSYYLLFRRSVDAFPARSSFHSQSGSCFPQF